MFYPVESLKRGGRFYLCWVADSWPLRFAAITHRQLWSHDIRKLCDDLKEVVTNESGRPANRFSLRLSSQLMRGLVRLYEKKVTVLLGDLCMIHANVFKNTNKKWIVRETIVVAGQSVERTLPQLPWVPIPEEVEPEHQVMEMIQNSGNVVSNIQDITLKEATIPEFRLPPNDNFEEEHPNQGLQQLVNDTSIEQMRKQKDQSNMQLSGLEIPLDVSTLDKSLLKPQGSLLMEQMPDLDKTLYRKSTGEELRPDFEKDIPDIPEIPPPASEPEMQVESVIEVTEPIPEIAPQIVAIPNVEETIPVQIELEELEEQPQARKRRNKHILIIDKKIRIDSEVLKERISNPLVEVRCEDPTDDIIDLRVPWDVYSRRPASAGHRFRTRISDKITRMFQRNLAFTMPDRDMTVEEVLAQPRRSRPLQTIAEDEEPQERPQIQVEPQEPQNISEINISALPEEIVMGRPTDIDIPMEVEKDMNVLVESHKVSTNVEPMDISDLPTQKLETLSQHKKRVSEYDKSPKRQRVVGYMSFRESQSQKAVEVSIAIDKENIPPSNEQTRPSDPPIEEPNITSMLQQAGLSELQIPVVEPIEKSQRREQVREGSESSETPLGSLDRTKVSLGDSIRTTDSQKFIRNNWGIEGTMVKIMGHIKAGVTPLSVDALITRGPVMPGYKKIIAARCFTSILKLKQHEFIKIVKDPETLEIRDIILGPKFAGLG